ncbi:MAG: 30S ribosomal protein S8 [Candidatus Marinimicrobia bacterium]|jgi:small subunit ribosomal protein S8|nr:30S ribosomal protein S8 [Candidatus Neomarinimicrobiota bacterium]MDD4960680.1 30S ribosomal protein S8 [Candidatus Neomarinimicrobiota bacterium]MDD5709201.1 30S ribosomal protein S8 [Candidatus Neomarinimicrobiota bacterium]MDX9777930.1 30S ribosomal protein S8 [bacterium]
MLTDPIADFLTRIRNACKAGHPWVEIPASKMKARISLVLREKGYIKDFILIEDGKQGMLRLFLKYQEDGRPVIYELERISKPGRRIYVKSTDIPRVNNGLGIGIISTSHGVITDIEARKMQLGGEYLCKIW